MHVPRTAELQYKTDVSIIHSVFTVLCKTNKQNKQYELPNYSVSYLWSTDSRYLTYHVFEFLPPGGDVEREMAALGRPCTICLLFETNLGQNQRPVLQHIRSEDRQDLAFRLVYVFNVVNCSKVISQLSPMLTSF